MGVSHYGLATSRYTSDATLDAAEGNYVAVLCRLSCCQPAARRVR